MPEYCRIALFVVGIVTDTRVPATRASSNGPMTTTPCVRAVAIVVAAAVVLSAGALFGRGAFASLSFHSRRGAVFYALGDKAATHGKMEALIVTAAQLRALVAQDDEDNPNEDLRIVSPTAQGFVLQRVFSEAPDLLPEARLQAGKLECAPESVSK